MTPERWQHVGELFHAALARDPAVREDFLRALALSDPEAAEEVRALLRSHHAASEFLEKPACEVAPTLAMGLDLLHPGTSVGPYRIVRELGRGGMGIVYEAEDTRLRRSVALKALPPAYRNDPIRRERLMREARAAAALAHPAVATVYALEELDGALYLASELVRGETLRAEVERGLSPDPRLLETLIELAAGLAAAHAAGIVHRDFKPDNIVRCSDGRVKILDFGLARMESDATQLRLTRTDVVMGTPGYMAPEQFTGKPVDARSDIYAFGVVAWELATGTHPVDSSTALVEPLAQGSDPEPIGATGTGLPVDGLDAVLRRCLRRDPAERHASGGELLADLQRLQRAAPTPAQGLSAMTSSGRSPFWWWECHQGLIAVLISSMPVAAWFIRRGTPDGWPRVLFLIVLAFSTVAVTIRLNLLFTARVHRGHLERQLARVSRVLISIEGSLGVGLVLAAAPLAGAHDGLAAVLVTLGVATLASLGVIEPATARAAGLGGSGRDASR